MTDHLVQFAGASDPVRVPTGTHLSEASRLAGFDIHQPCGGQGRCGRCVVQITEGSAHRRSALRLSPEDIAAGYALACQTVITGDVSVTIPPQEAITRHLTTDRTAAEVPVPHTFNPTIRRINLTLTPPTMQDQTDDWSRLQIALRQQAGIENVQCTLLQLQRLGSTLRDSDWHITAVLDDTRLIAIPPEHTAENAPLWGLAIDIGTTTVSLWLVDLISGEVRAQAADYNQQISCGEDVISRVIYASKVNGADELKQRVLATIHRLCDSVCDQIGIWPREIIKATIAGNTIMIHLLLGIPADSIRLSPFIPAVNQVPLLRARDVGLNIHPDAVIDCLPNVASYVGADITAGVLSSGLDDTELVSLFLDIGTNGEIVLGSREWLVTCACSAGPAFEGAGVLDGMRATQGAIEEVWINGDTYEPDYRVIGGGKPRGICGSGLISLLAELFLTGVIDKSGSVKLDLPTNRARMGEHGPEYVIVWEKDSATGQDIVISRVDVDNLLRAKAAIYAGFTILAESVGLSLDTVEQVLIGGSFGKYINVEKAIQIGLLPDMPWDRFQFLGNTSIRGAYLALLDRESRARITAIASRMTYLELSADNTFYDAFTSALFLPHTDLARFPTVQAAIMGT
jgi:uncharacterized 2Fe-2S/4Fe-4S cluster protein (DUF4445 family)